MKVGQAPGMRHLENPPMASVDERRTRRRIPFLGVGAFLVLLIVLGLVIPPAISLLSKWDLGIADTAASFRSSGPTIVQLERLQYLVSTRVRVADVLVGESRWLEGSWIIQGDALLAVDMAKADIKDKHEKARTAVIVLPQPDVLSARVNHEKTRQCDVKSRSWIPLASSVLGDRNAMEKQAMLHAQQLVERAAGSDDSKSTARIGAEEVLGEFYRAVGSEVSVRWK
jgi:hypothetical protein